MKGFEPGFTGKITGSSPVRLKLQTPLYSPSNNATNFNNSNK